MTRPAFHIVPPNAYLRAAQRFPGLYLTDTRPDLFEQLRETLAERREQRKAAFVSALVVASNAIVIGFAVVAAVLCVTKGGAW